MDISNIRGMDRTQLVEMLSNQFQRTKGFEVSERLEWLDYCQSIFHENYADIERFSHFSKQHSSAFKMFMDDEYTSNVQGNFIRYLHNFLTSSKALVDYTRRSMNKWYSDTELLTSYKEKVNAEFVDDPLTQFIEALRNYCSHRNPVGIVTEVFPGRESDCCIASIHKESLLRWEKLSPQARAYIEEYDNNIPIMPPITEYKEKVIGFRDWLKGEIINFHASDIYEAKWYFQAIQYAEQGDVDSLIRSCGISIQT